MVLRDQHPSFANFIVFTMADHLRKFFLLNINDGSVHVLCLPIFAGREPVMFRASPSSRPGDGLIAWLETYASLRAGGYFPPSHFISTAPAQSVSLFPIHPQLCSVCVTEGVEVVASAIFIPEASAPREHTFAYSIRIRLLSIEDQLLRLETEQKERVETAETHTRGSAVHLVQDTREPDSSSKTVNEGCVLKSRFWHITDGTGHVDQASVGGLFGVG